MTTKRTLLLRLGLLGSLWAVGGADVLACGDKLVVVGRGLRPKRMKGGVPASILLYADPKGSLPAALEEGHLRKDLEKAGHRLRSVSSREELRRGQASGASISAGALAYIIVGHVAHHTGVLRERYRLSQAPSAVATA